MLTVSHKHYCELKVNFIPVNTEHTAKQCVIEKHLRNYKHIEQEVKTIRKHNLSRIIQRCNCKEML